VAGQRAKLLDKILQHGFEQTMEEVAYTWFNRFAAMRYMELHDFLEHGHRVLSSRDGGLPELLRHAADVSLPGLQAAKVQELQLAGNRDDELYKQLLVAQCNELSRVMPFLFERIDDETELLLPDNLLRTDSIVAKLVAGVSEEDWQEIEVIGWLYQFYISEKKDQVIGKVVKSEDIPAATQLFTPNWIVQYLVQNSVGRLWLMANPQSTLASQWPYYITPAEQTPEVQAQLDALIHTRVAEDGDTLNPESITVLDPACGSGHILVVAYDVLKAIYLERGYQPRAIPRLILEKNLYGLDIDDRAAQMAGFALLMKARADDRRLFTATDDAGNLQPPKLNVLSLQESKGLNVDELATHLAPHQVQRATISALVDTFEHAKTFGSLIQIPYALKTHLAVLPQVLAAVKQSGDIYARAAADDLLPLVQQAQVLAVQFDAVVANPPYIGNKGLNEALKSFARENFPDSKADIFAMFIERNLALLKRSGSSALVTMQSWMFLSSFEALRGKVLSNNALLCLSHFPYENRTPTAMGINFGISAFVVGREKLDDYKAHFCCGRHHELDENGKPTLFPPQNERLRYLGLKIFEDIPGNPISYWINPGLRKVFGNATTLESKYPPKTGMTTGDDGRFLRQWFEVSEQFLATKCSSSQDAAASGRKWFPYNKGGIGNRWHGHCNFVVNWKDDGEEIKKWVVNNPNDPNTTSWSRRVFNHDLFFKPGLTWTLLNSRTFNVRSLPAGNILNVNGPTISIPVVDECNYVLGFLNSKVASTLVQVINPTAANNPGDIGKLPLLFTDVQEVAKSTAACVAICKSDWDDSEVSFDFQESAFVAYCHEGSVSKSYRKCIEEVSRRISVLKELEERNNNIFIDVYGLRSELTPDVPDEQITLHRSDRDKDSQRLISYAIGCMMGRYSLDEPGLIYAHAGNVGFDPSRYTRFAADADGILPITDEHWFDDDAPARVRDFLQVVWGPETLAENMAWLAESLGGKASETPEETIRRYVADKFYKDHLQTYKKRPIYWLFSSGKQGAFQALVYLHRYNEGTLSRMRAEYVIPLTTKLATRLEMLEQDANAASSASSASARTKIRKQIEGLRKKQVELLSFDEKLRHHADMRISLDLDDGVKVNYGKFGDLLDSVKVVTGGGSDD
jgi:type II restriction/modification system DNA methylase subunit YeeA